MKWFKHESQARNDERIARLEDKAGLEGYGFYFKLLEIVSSKMDATSKCEVTYSLTSWGRQANVTTKKAVFLLQCCHDVGLIIAQRCSDDMIVNIPNLLKYRDNHTKNLQATSKQELELELEEELELEVDKNKPNKFVNSAKKPAEISTPKNTVETETNLQIACRDTWAKYSHAYFLKYQTNPVRNAMVNTQVKNFVKKLSNVESPLVAAWFLSHTDIYYVRAGHGFGLLAKDAEKLRTEWATGKVMSDNVAAFQTKAERIAANNKKAGDEFVNGNSEKTIEGEVVND